jgi:hypothetical protein
MGKEDKVDSILWKHLAGNIQLFFLLADGARMITEQWTR